MKPQPIEIVDKRGVQKDEPLIKIIETGRSYDAPRPINGMVMISRNAEPVVFAGTQFIMPDTAKQKPNQGLVIAVGPEAFHKVLKDGKETLEPVCKPGDLVTFGQYNNEDQVIDGNVFTLVDYRDIKFVQAVTYVVPSC